MRNHSHQSLTHACMLPCRSDAVADAAHLSSAVPGDTQPADSAARHQQLQQQQQQQQREGATPASRLPVASGNATIPGLAVNSGHPTPALARSASTSEPPPGFGRLPKPGQPHPKENGAVSSSSNPSTAAPAAATAAAAATNNHNGGSNNSGGSSSHGSSSANQRPRAAWTGDPPDSLGLGSSATATVSSRGSTAPAQLHVHAGRASVAGREAAPPGSGTGGAVRGQLQRDGRSASGPAGQLPAVTHHLQGCPDSELCIMS